MIDGCGREIDYVRISVTDRCNLRCVYCMPEEGVPLVSHCDILSYNEIQKLAFVFVKLGIRKIKLTGGEPLVRKGLPDLVKQLKQVPGIEQVTLTTNGLLLGEQMENLAAAQACRIEESFLARPVTDASKLVHKVTESRIRLLGNEAGEPDTYLRTVVSSRNRTIVNEGNFTA